MLLNRRSLIPSAYTHEKKEIPKSEQTSLHLDERTNQMPMKKESWSGSVPVISTSFKKEGQTLE